MNETNIPDEIIIDWDSIRSVTYQGEPIVIKIDLKQELSKDETKCFALIPRNNDKKTQK